MAPSVTLYAIWEPVTLKVTFMRNLSDTDTLSNSQTFTYKDSGSCGTFSDKGWSKTGYTLSGWTEHRGSTDVMYSTLSGVNNNWLAGKAPSVTLYAVWKANKYTVTYNANGGSGTMTADTATYGQNYKTKANGFIAPTGKKFAGWNEKSDGTGTSWTNYIGVDWVWNYTKNVTLYAQWEPIDCNITYSLTTLSDSVYPYTNESGKYNVYGPTKQYVYYCDAGFGTGVSAKFSSSSTQGGIYYSDHRLSVGKKYTWTVKFKVDSSGVKTLNIGQEQGGTKIVNVKSGTWQYETLTFIAGDTQWNSFVFYVSSGQWNSGDTIEILDLSIKEVGTANLETQSRKYGATIGTLPKAPSRTGYTFEGWYTDPFGGTEITTSTVVTGNVTYYARWKDTTAPTASLSVSSVGCQNIELSISASDTGSGLEKIDVYMWNNSTSTYELKDTLWSRKAISLKKNYTGLNDNTTYWFKIIAYDAFKNPTTVTDISGTTLKAVCLRTSDNKKYASVQSGIDDNTSATLKLLKNHTESAVVNNGKDITFDPGGYTLTGTNRNFSGTMWDIALTNYGALTLTGSGTISSSGATNSYAIWQSSGKPFKMKGAIISGKTNETLVHIASGTAEFTGGNIVLEDNTSNNINGNAIFASGTGSFEITTGSVIQGRNGGSSSLVKSSSASECKITGGYVGKFGNTSGSLVYNAGSGTLSISDGKFDMFGLGSGVVNDTGTLNISGGTINLEVKKAGATVWQKGSSAAVANTSSGSVTISGGTINAYSSIGINNYTNGTVELSNVTINNAAPYSGANDIMGATVGATTQKDYTGARGKITIKSGTTIENTNGGIAVYASAYGDVYLYGGYITSKASTWTMYFGHGERFHPSDAISTTISKYVKNTGGGIEYHFALNQDLKKLYFYANNNKYNILDKEKVGV